MGILSVASGNSVWRGYDCYRDCKVVSCVQTGETQFSGEVRGQKLYTVNIDYKHPRKSSCNCPHAAGRRIVCKHMVALYFTVFPMEADILWEQNEKWTREEEEKNDKVYDRVGEYIHNLSEVQAKNELYSLLMDSSEWLFDKFVREHGLDEPYVKEETFFDEESFRRLTQNVCNAIRMSDDDMTIYYDKSSKEIILVSEYFDTDIEDYNMDDLLLLPDKHDFDEYKVMKEFVLRQSEDMKEKLLNALSGKGAYGKFKEIVNMLGIEKFWYAYCDECMRIFAEDWCRKNIKY